MKAASPPVQGGTDLAQSPQPCFLTEPEGSSGSQPWQRGSAAPLTASPQWGRVRLQALTARSFPTRMPRAFPRTQRAVTPLSGPTVDLLLRVVPREH